MRIDSGKQSVHKVPRPCSNKRKQRDDHHHHHHVAATPSPAHPHSSSRSKTWKIMTYNVWFRQDIELYNRMKALGNLIQLHSPDAICLQEVTRSIYEIFQKTSWWRSYNCTIADASSFPESSYFCLQLTRLPVKSSVRIPFRNSIMGRELIITQVEIEDDKTITIATAHLESPCPSPPKWNQMFSKERVTQAREAVSFLDVYDDVIFCGDMNWNDGLDGPFPLPVGWIDAWTEMRPGEDGFTYDNRTNRMIKSRRVVQGRLDRFVCKTKDLGLVGIEMIGRDEIPELRYVKEKRGGVEEMVLPVLPSDHFGLVLTIALL
ncbi:hypothetical protein M569_08969 [Genlisea aurea]|uniref:Endonuclease/exonuclease/phosphatase domain-containing protein n=1 Tax=Genlisea aurea TaxID=192259 RepID=S8DRS5_9LAMI|nr:hypothetical protein M569_08969 [Genlisea aurea]